MNFTTKTVHSVSDYELESVVLDVYGKQINISAALESDNDSLYELTVSGAPWTDYDRNLFNEWLRGAPESYGIPRLILDDLARNKIIPGGNWIINISW